MRFDTGSARTGIWQIQSYDDVLLQESKTVKKMYKGKKRFDRFLFLGFFPHFVITQVGIGILVVLPFILFFATLGNNPFNYRFLPFCGIEILFVVANVILLTLFHLIACGGLQNAYVNRMYYFGCRDFKEHYEKLLSDEKITDEDRMRDLEEYKRSPFYWNFDGSAGPIAKPDVVSENISEPDPHDSDVVTISDERLKEYDDQQRMLDELSKLRGDSSDHDDALL
ncbi:MAG: hypothetical protein K6F63_07475 [Lachnospiraceae bacterium]|nr:hypothetical protein [Lachnospiraceae bacterium]